MSGVVNLINQYSMPLLVLGQITLAALMYYFKDKFAPKHTEKHLEELSTRVTLIETGVEQMPQRGELHRLELKITELQGDLKRVDENLESAEKLTDLLREHTNRMDDFLKRKA